MQTFIYTSPASGVLDAVEEVRRLGLDAWAARRIEERMVGRRQHRRLVSVVAPAWGPYLFVTSEVGDLNKVQRVKGLRYLAEVPPSYMATRLRPLMLQNDSEFLACQAAVAAAEEAEREVARITAEAEEARVAADLRAEAARDAATSAIAAAGTFATGDVITIVSGALAGQRARFKAVEEVGGIRHVLAEVSGLLGRILDVRLDPKNVSPA